MRDGHLPVDERSLGAFLMARARRASDARLAACAGGGLVAAVTGALLRPPFWLSLTAGAVALSAYGAWAILDRELHNPAARRSSRGHRLLLAARAAAAGLGATAAVFAGLTLFFSALGDSWQL